MDQIRIMIVDDQRLFASSLKVVLESSRQEGLSVVGVMRDGKECLDHLESLRPDIILMDVRMPGLDGVETTKIVHQKYPNTKILILSTFDDDTYVHHALLNGATGYVLKNVEPEELISCIKAVFRGSFLVSSSVGYRVFTNEEAGTENQTGLHRENRILEVPFPGTEEARGRGALSAPAGAQQSRDLTKALHCGTDREELYQRDLQDHRS
jgi:DNA-binding NarL/FixJ family response regulator